MLDVLVKLVDLIETILAKELPDEQTPAVNDRLAAVGQALEAMSMDIKDRTSQSS